MWIAKTKDGTAYSENDINWAEIEKDVVELSLKLDNGQVITLPSNMATYSQFKTASASLSGADWQVESRTIGFDNILIRVNEKTKNISIEIK